MDIYRAAIAQAFGRTSSDIKDLELLASGMTNRSFRFKLDGRRYIFRMPGEGTDRIIDRKNEGCVYEILRGRGISENIVYFSTADGIKISEYFENAKPCDPSSREDAKACMGFLRGFHGEKLTAMHSVDLFERIEFYESLSQGCTRAFADYGETKEMVFSLKVMIENLPKEKSLTHMDAVPNNFLFVNGGIRLIDWEYAAMQDPHLDIAMFALNSAYGGDQLEELISFYFTEGCPDQVRIKIYCYMSVCGLMSSNWCEYRKLFGEDFREYSRKQYYFAREYFEKVSKMK